MIKLEDIKKFAKENGFDDVEYLGEWEGFQVYFPFFTDEEEHFIGMPLKILVDDDSMRMSDYDESMTLLNVFE